MLKSHTGKVSNHCHHFFSRNSKLVYCNAVGGLLQELGCAHNSEEWRVFVDSSKFTLKTVLLHNGNIHPSITIAHSVHKKETYENIDLHLKTICYPKYDWKIFGDFTVIWLPLGMLSDYTKFCCFLCEWNSRAKENITKLRMVHTGKLSSRGNVSEIYLCFTEIKFCYCHYTSNWGSGKILL